MIQCLNNKILLRFFFDYVRHTCIKSILHRSFLYCREYEYRGVKFFLESEKRCKFNPYANYTDYFTGYLDYLNVFQFRAKFMIHKGQKRTGHNYYITGFNFSENICRNSL